MEPTEILERIGQAIVDANRSFFVQANITTEELAAAMLAYLAGQRRDEPFDVDKFRGFALASVYEMRLKQFEAGDVPAGCGQIRSLSGDNLILGTNRR